MRASQTLSGIAIERNADGTIVVTFEADPDARERWKPAADDLALDDRHHWIRYAGRYYVPAVSIDDEP